MLAASDIVSVHAPELPDTHHLLDARRIALLRPDAVVINTARGTLIDTDALVRRCRAGTLRAILDVTDPEPLPADSVLRSEEHTSELQSLMRISYAVFCLKNKKTTT